MQHETKNLLQRFRVAFSVAGLLALLLSANAVFANTTDGLKLTGEFKSPGIESEISGIYPHPTSKDLYFAVANSNPVYKLGQSPKLDEMHRGKLLSVNKLTGEVVKSTELTGSDYGGIAFARNKLFISNLHPAEILEVDIESGDIVNRFALDSPAGGLAYDAEKNVLMAQLFARSPALAIIDIETGKTKEMLWSDETAMGLAKFGSTWLCTWASGFDEHAFGELRQLSEETGRVTGRVALDGVHFAAAPSQNGFVAMRAVDRLTGEVSIREYQLDEAKIAWMP